MGNYAGFTQVQLRKPKRARFDLSHNKKLSCRMGKLVPILVTETLPNDTFSGSSEVMLRLAPMLAPIYHMINVFVHFFFIPTRLLYKDWEKFITNGRLGTETPPVAPYIDIGAFTTNVEHFTGIGSLWDYLGGAVIEESVAMSNFTGVRISALPFAAYYRAWYDYYRDRNYIADNEFLPLPSGQMSDGFFEAVRLKTRAWEHEYFTSALPWTQRGDEVLIPMEGTGSVSYLDLSLVKNSDGSPANGGGTLTTEAVAGPATQINNSNGNDNVRIENIDEVQFTNSTISINDFRRSIALQQWLERNALAGSRYNESIMAHFARRTSDGRLQRAEYIGGGRVPVQISEVVTTAYSQDADTTIVPPGNLAGRGVSYGTANRIHYNCEEHGFILGIMSIMPKPGYIGQGIPRMFLQRETFLDYPWPSFANLGEQEVYQYELMASAGNVPNANTQQEPTVFGYQSRYADWKWIASTTHGDFKESLDFWHLDRKFATEPVLGATFVQFEDALQDRIFAVSDVDNCWCYIHNNLSVKRSLPYFGQPAGLV